MPLKKMGTKATGYGTPDAGPTVPTAPETAPALPADPTDLGPENPFANPPFRSADKSESRTSYGHTIVYMFKRGLYQSELYKKLMDFKSNDRAVKVLQLYLKKTRLHDSFTKFDVAGFGKGSLFSYDPEFVGSMRPGAFKRKVTDLYKSILEENLIHKAYLLESPDEDANVSAFVLLAYYTMLYPIYVTMLGNYGLMYTRSFPGVKRNFGPDKMKLTKFTVWMSKAFRGITEADLKLSPAQKMKIVKMILYYSAPHKIEVK